MPSNQITGDRLMRPLETSPEELRALVNAASALATEYWAGIDRRPAAPRVSGEQSVSRFRSAWSDAGLGRDVLNDFRDIAEWSRPTHGRFFGYVFGSGEPVGAVGDLLASTLNQNAGAWRSAPAAAAIEQTVIGWLADAIGCSGFHGSLCGGGSAANFMGLAMAREANAPARATGARPAVVYASSEVHMSIPKAVSLLGLGTDNLRRIPVDDTFRLRVEALEDAIAEDKAAGRKAIAIVASAGTVKTGAIDPLAELARIARREGLWLHIDGAYGALAALAVPERFTAIGECDSISLDAHKWFYQPVDCGCLLFRDREAARRTFSDAGDYVKTMSQDPIEGFAYFDESMELSRRFRALKLWLSLRYHGRKAFRDSIARDLGHAQLLAEMVRQEPALELLAPVTLSAVCFRHRSADNEAVLKSVLRRGRVYLSNATIGEHFALRACFVNHRTVEADVRSIVEEVIAAAGDYNVAASELRPR
jgi:glutamate/tyrosine decarboxylase-like PLP-dependent enzyme